MAKKGNWLSRLFGIPSRERSAEAGVKRQEEVDRQLPPRASDLVFNPFGRLVDTVKASVREQVPVRELGEREQYEHNLNQIKVIAFIGPSGTGKSTRALRIAREENISDIIDDGLLIHGSRILAGSSAKRAETKIDSVRQAIFDDPTRAETMQRVLAEKAPRELMILGTSEQMVERICDNLHLNRPERIIWIEDVTSEEERRLAKSVRMSEGKHTIPVPSMEIKHEFSGYLSDPIMKLKRRFDRSGRDLTPVVQDERTVVRPTFSTLGSYSISDKAMGEMLDIDLQKVPGVESVLDVSLDKEPYGIFLYIGVALYYGFNAQQVLMKVQQEATLCLERYTAVNVLATNVTARRLVHLNAEDEAGVEASG